MGPQIQSGSSWFLPRAGHLAILSGFTAVLAAVIFVAAHSDPNRQHSLTILAFAVAGLAVGCLLLAVNAGEPSAVRAPWLLTGSIVGALCAAAFAYYGGMRQLGGFDHSILVDTGWRLFRGQRPFHDFPSTTPIGFALGAQLAFQGFGVSWKALTLFNAIFCASALLWTCGLSLRIFLGQPLLAFVLALCINCMALLVVCFWWYNPITLATAIVFVLSSVHWLLHPRSFAAIASCFFSALLLSMMKANTAGILLVGSSLTLLFSTEHRRAAFTVFAAAFLAFLLILWTMGISLPALLAGYTAVASRGVGFGQSFSDVIGREIWLSVAGLAAMLLPLLVAGYLRSGWRMPNRIQSLGVVSLIGGIIAFFADGELKLVELSLIFLSTVLLVSRRVDTPGKPSSLFIPRAWAAYLILLGTIFASVALGQGVTRHRVMTTGPGRFFEYKIVEAPIASGFFGGLRSGPILRASLSEIEQLLASAGAPKRIYFGPRMQWGYAACGIDSPSGQPVWWHPGVAFDAKKEPVYLERWMDRKFDVLVFYKDDHTYFSPEFLELIAGNYNRDDQYSALTAYRRKGIS